MEKTLKTPGYITLLHMCTINKDHMMYGSSDMECDRIFSHFGPSTALFNLPNNPKNQSFEKMKKTPEDIIVLHTCTINDNHMIYSSCDMKHYRHFGPFLSFWAIFCPFTKLTTQKLKTLKKWKNLVKKS